MYASKYSNAAAQLTEVRMHGFNKHAYSNVYNPPAQVIVAPPKNVHTLITITVCFLLTLFQPHEVRFGQFM